MNGRYRKCRKVTEMHFCQKIMLFGIFLKNGALSLFYIYGILNSCKILEKSLERFLRKTIMDRHTDGLTWAITKDPTITK